MHDRRGCREDRVSRHLRAVPRFFTLIEMLVVIAIIAVLFSLISPALKKAVDTARGAKCMSNMHQVAIALSHYEDDNDGSFITFHHGTLVTGEPIPGMGDTYWVFKLGREYMGGQPGMIKLPVFECPVVDENGGSVMIGGNLGGDLVTQQKLPYPYINAPFNYGRTNYHGDLDPSTIVPRAVKIQKMNSPATWLQLLDVLEGCIAQYSPNWIPYNTDVSGDGIPDTSGIVLGYNPICTYNLARPRLHETLPGYIYGACNISLCDGHVERFPFELWQDPAHDYWSD